MTSVGLPDAHSQRGGGQLVASQTIEDPVQLQEAIAAAVARMGAATTGNQKKAAAQERAALEAKSEAEQARETAAAIEEACMRGTITTKYDDPEAVFAALEDGATQLVRGTWLRDQRVGAVLAKRGGLPKSALIGVEELRRIYAASRVVHKSLPIIAVSQ